MSWLLRTFKIILYISLIAFILTLILIFFGKNILPWNDDGSSSSTTTTSSVSTSLTSILHHHKSSNHLDNSTSIHSRSRQHFHNDLINDFNNNQHKNNFIKDTFFHTKTKFLPPETFHSPFNPPTTIEQISGIPIAYGDYNSDTFTDIFILTNNGTTIKLLKGHSCVDGKTVLTLFGSRRCLSHFENFSCEFLNKNFIYNLVATDFTGELHQDLLITMKNHQIYDKDKHEGGYDIWLVKGNSQGDQMDCSQKKLLVKNALSEPFVLDYDGDMISDFIVETEKCPFLLVLGADFDSLQTVDNDEDDIEDDKRKCLRNLSSDIKSLARPHSSGFLNLNSYKKDMTPDIFLNGKNKFEYIFNDPEKGFQKSEIFSFPDVPLRGQSAFVDINYDGLMDHLIPVCLDSETFSSCTKPDLMILNPDTKSWVNVLNTTLPLGSEFNLSLTFVEMKIYDYITIPVTLHIGDINYDGFPDFATILIDRNTSKTYGAIFLNKLDDKNADDKYSRRKFHLDWISEYDQDVITISLFDIYNNGKLNLMMTTRNKTDDTLKLEAFDYYVEKSIYFSFLRVNIISGLCSDKSIESECPEHLAYGGTPPGATACFQGPLDEEHSCAYQMAQSAHFALQTPYMIFGLGDILNVVNDLSVSIANGNESQRKKTWDEIIPGSKLVIVPFTPDQVNEWELRVFINMSIYSMVALLFLLVLGFILAFAIAVLHIREKAEDRADNQQYRNAWL